MHPTEKKHIWRSGILGLVTGDALGVPVEFRSRMTMDLDPVTGMRGFGTHDQPAGTWSDDSSMALAALDCMGREDFSLEAVADAFLSWYSSGEYTPWGKVFDCGNVCRRAITNYEKRRDISRCGLYGERDNGNGSLMWILPLALFAHAQQEKGMEAKEALDLIHRGCAITHAHVRSKIACGLFYFLVKSILESSVEEPLPVLQRGIDEGFAFYADTYAFGEDLRFYARLRDLDAFSRLPREQIRSSGYVVDCLEAVVWSLLQARGYRDAVLTAVNLGDDTDTTSAVCGGLASLLYGEEDIPADWKETLARLDWILSLVERAAERC